LYAFPIGKVEAFPWNTQPFLVEEKADGIRIRFSFFTGAALETVQVPVQGHSVDSLSGKQFLILS